MTNEKFWNECYPGSIREKVATFIDKSPLLGHLKGKKYYELEDAIVGFIRENAETIFHEVEKEWLRDDTVDFASKGGEKIGATLVCNALPIDVIDALVEEWQNDLGCDDEDAQLRDYHIDNALHRIGVFDGLNDYQEEDLYLYAAYIQDWYFNHPREYNQAPVSIKEFFDCEFKESPGRYKNLALVFKKRFSKC